MLEDGPSTTPLVVWIEKVRQGVEEAASAPLIQGLGAVPGVIALGQGRKDGFYFS